MEKSEIILLIDKVAKGISDTEMKYLDNKERLLNILINSTSIMLTAKTQAYSELIVINRKQLGITTELESRAIELSKKRNLDKVIKFNDALRKKQGRKLR